MVQAGHELGMLCAKDLSKLKMKGTQTAGSEYDISLINIKECAGRSDCAKSKELKESKESNESKKSKES